MLQAFLGVETTALTTLLVMSLSSLDLLVLFSVCHMLLEVHYFSFLKFKFSKCSFSNDILSFIVVCCNNNPFLYFIFIRSSFCEICQSFSKNQLLD